MGIWKKVETGFVNGELFVETRHALPLQEKMNSEQNVQVSDVKSESRFLYRDDAMQRKLNSNCVADNIRNKI